jgi:hypothetical protein
MFEFLLQELVGGAQGIQERPEGVAFLKVAQSVYPHTTTSYLGLNIPFGADGKRFVQCTYSDEWVKQCISREPISVSRLAGLAQALPAPLDWSALSDTPRPKSSCATCRTRRGGGKSCRFPCGL